ncbi:unnamed protein product [Alopecurus aequalis]
MKGGNTVKLLSTLVLAVWVLWTGVQSHTTCNTCREDSKFGAPNYPKVQYTVDTSNPDAFREMIARLRELLTSRREYRQGIPILPEPTSVPDSARYILLEIIVQGTGGVTFAIDVTNVYFISYLVGTTRYFFEEAAARADELLFTDAMETSPARRSSNYQQLESRAGQSRENIALGLHSLDNAIRTLVTGRPEDARSFLIIIQMVAESVRYWAIELRVLGSLGGSFQPDSSMLDFENNWGTLSEQIQNSDVFAFQSPVTIGGQEADSVLSAVIRGALFLMLFQCRPRPPSTHLHSVDPATEILGRDLGLCLLDPRLLQTDEEEDESCKHLVDPRSRIMGRDGLCVDVEGFIYRDKNPVILFTCRSSDFRNQLWNFRTDGRIVSLDKCLAASGGTPGSTVVIHECETLHASAVQWAMSDSGTLYNRVSGLVLDATSGSGKQLTLQRDASSSFQAWQSTNITTAADVYIHGENNRCFYYDGHSGVYTQECRKGYSWHKWRLYPDSTIRPVEWLEGCLELASLEHSTRSYNYIQAGYCSSYPEKHRWIFTYKGSIMNLKSKLVVDEDRDYAGKGYLKAAPFQGGLINQIWRPEFII